jgi:putative membrane protein
VAPQLTAQVDLPMTAPPIGPDDELESDPDVRFSYANERTFLAWNRTALAMVTAGLAITQLLPPFDVPGGRRMIGIPLIVAGTVVAVASFVQWQRNERAMRLGQPLPSSILPALVAIVVGLSAVVALVLALFGGGESS